MMDPMAGGPMPPMGPPPGMPPPMGGPGVPPVDEDGLMAMLLQALMGKWDSGEAQLAGEKEALITTLLQLVQSGGELPPGDFAEGAPQNMGMGPQAMPPMEGPAPY